MNHGFSPARRALGRVDVNMFGPGVGVTRAFVAEIARQYSQDIPIWENKRFLPRPLLCDGDGPILELRRYFAQFYPAPPAGSGA